MLGLLPEHTHVREDEAESDQDPDDPEALDDTGQSSSSLATARRTWAADLAFLPSGWRPWR